MTGLEPAAQQLAWFAIALARAGAAFVMLPLLSPRTIPALVRNSFLVGVGLVVMALQPRPEVLHAAAPVWLGLFSRELFIGLSIGFFFGGILWSFELAGEFIDAKVGARSGMTDPFSGDQTSVFADFMERLANFVFASCGGLLFVTNTILRSYVIWPIWSAAPHLGLHGGSVFTDAFQAVMSLALALAAPALLLLTLVEGAAGLLNRISPQLHAFSAQLSVKNWLAAWILLLMGGLLTQTLATEVADRMPLALRFVASLGGS